MTSGSGNRDSSRQALDSLRSQGIAILALVMLLTGGWGVRAEPDDSSHELAETVELPVESIRLASDRLTLQDSLEISASVVLPDSCHYFERLEGAVDEESHRVTLVAVGGRQGEVCSQAISVEETALLMYPLPSEGTWMVEARYFDEAIQAELTVLP
ncbi:MAG: hypothetical protein AB4050_07905 [Synechococcus sp.]